MNNAAPMFAPVEQRPTRKTAMRWPAAVGGLLAAIATVALAQTNAPTAASPPAAAAPAAAPQTNAVIQAAPAPASTNAVSLVEMIQNDAAFQSYTNLLEHSLFLPTSEIGAGSAGDTGPAFAGSLRVTGFIKRGSDVQASIEDRSDPEKKYFLHAGDIIPDTEIRIVGFDLRGRAVLLKKGDEEGRLEYESETMVAPTAGKPGVPGQPGGAMMPRPGMLPTPPAPGMSGGFRPSTGGPGMTASPSPGGSGGSSGGAAGSQSSRREQREQQIARLRQVLQSTPDPAAKQRLQSYIQMLEKANAQE